MDNLAMSVDDARKILVEFNKWRRGDDPYGWYEEPEKTLQMPYNSTEIGKALDVAILVLGEKINEGLCNK